MTIGYLDARTDAERDRDDAMPPPAVTTTDGGPWYHDIGAEPMTITTDEPTQLADTLRLYHADMQRVADAFAAELPPGTSVDWRPLDGCLLGRWWATIDGPQRDARPIQAAVKGRLGALSVDVGVLSTPLRG